MISYMDVRCKEILSLIIFSPDCVSMEQLEKEMNLSKRSVYYEICKINEWMEQNGFPELKVMRGKGYYIEEAVKTQIEAMLDKKQSKEIYIFSPKERVYVIICYIIYSERPVYINELMDCCGVSRNTIFSDLKVVVSLLQEYRLQLGYKSKEGYTIEGDAIRVRAIFFYYFNKLLPLYESENLEFISKKRIKDYLQSLKGIEKELKINYVHDSLVSIAALIPILERNNQKLHFPDIKKQEVMDTKEFRLIQKYFPALIEEEQIYLCLHLLGSRTLDVSEDFMYNRSNQTVYEITKALVDEFEKEENPFLGWRAIRISLELRQMFKEQLRAILRAGRHGNVRIMFPMIISLEELEEAKNVLAECRRELSAEGVEYSGEIPIGIMVETPASVFLAEEFAEKVDFFSIGTNDLTQYLLCVDRGNKKIADKYDYFHPAVLKAIRYVIDAGHKKGIKVGMCGEMAGDRKAVSLLLEMGLDEFSMSAGSLDYVREQILNN